jgi:hypothetical protein
VWFGAIYWLAAIGTFVSSQDERPVTLAVAFLTPLLLFLVGVRLPGWRSLVVSIPPVFLIALNGWRFIGLGFLMAYREGLLPGGFAWPAGLGDMAQFRLRSSRDGILGASSALRLWYPCPSPNSTATEWSLPGTC